MRHLRLVVAPELGGLVLRLATELGAYACSTSRASGANGERRCVVDVDLPGSRVGVFVESVRDEVGDARMVLFSAGTTRLQRPGRSSAAPWYWPVESISSLELVLSALQSLGSWRWLVLFALLSGVIAAYGLILGSGYLLVASMLIAPMGAPMMVAVVGTALGDWRTLLRGTLRFVAATLLVAGAGWATGAAYGLRITTPMIDQVTALSILSGVIAVAAGLAGGVSAAQSGQSSFVSAGATGFLIAAALAPPASVLGLGVVIRRWDVAAIAGFVLFYQYVAVLMAGAAGLRLHGVRPGAPGTGERGSRVWRGGIVTGAGLILVLLTVWQLRQGPLFLQADVTQETTAMVQDAISDHPGMHLVSVATRLFPGDRRVDGMGLLVEIRVRPPNDSTAVTRMIPPLRDAVAQAAMRRWPGVVPLVNVTVITRPGNEGPGERTMPSRRTGSPRRSGAGGGWNGST